MASQVTVATQQSPRSQLTQQSPRQQQAVRKIAVMGYPCVGKSSLTLQFVQGHFPDAYDTTIEDLHSKSWKLQGRDYLLRITDTAGQQEYTLFPRSCAVDVDGYVLVYAIDDRKSFEIIQVIHDKIQENVGEAPLVVVGNKLDLQHTSRNIPKEEGQRLATSWKAAFVEVSARDRNAVNQVFEKILVEIEKAKGNYPSASAKRECSIATSPSSDAMMTGESGANIFVPPGERPSPDGGGGMSTAIIQPSNGLGNPDLAQVGVKIEALKKWTVSTFKNSKHSVMEQLGKVDRTVDKEFEEECEALRELHRRYSQVLKTAQTFMLLVGQLVDAEKNLAESLYQLSLREACVKEECTISSDCLRKTGDSYEKLNMALSHVVSSLETLATKTITDTLLTVQAAEHARLEFDVFRHEFTQLQSQPTASALAVQNAQNKADAHREKYEALKKDVRTKLRLLEENREKVMSKELVALQKALSSYYGVGSAALNLALAELQALPRKHSHLEH